MDISLGNWEMIFCRTWEVEDESRDVANLIHYCMINPSYDWRNPSARRYDRTQIDPRGSFRIRPCDIEVVQVKIWFFRLFNSFKKTFNLKKIAPKYSAIDVSQRVDAFYTHFCENGSVVVENDVSKVGEISEKSKFWLTNRHFLTIFRPNL